MKLQTAFFHERSTIAKTLLIMKLMAILLFATCMQVSATGFSQTITLTERKITLKKLFKKINEQSGFQFFFKDSLTRNMGKLDIEVTNASIEQVLDICFKNLPLTYSIVEKAIVIKDKPLSVDKDPEKKIESLFYIEGKVTDDKGKPLQDVSVIVKGSTKGVSTNANGEFRIEVKEGDVLEFSSVGYKKTSIVVGAGKYVTIQMELEVVAGSEVVVVGYGTQQKAKVTGSIATVSGDEIRKMPVTNLTNSLAGKLPGVFGINSSGAPGAGTDFSIHGVSSYNNAPTLFVIDGTIRTAADFAALNPNDIESISALKDAGAAAVYGVRAANGVLLVTTRRGKSGKPQFTLNSSLAYDKPSYFPDVMNAYEYASYQKAAAVNIGATPRFTDQQIADYQSGKLPDTDWQKLIFGGSAVTQQHNLSVSGGSEAIKYFFSGGYLNQTGIYPNVGYKRYNLRANTDIKITSTLTAIVNLEGYVAKNTAPNIAANTLWQNANTIAGTYQAFYKDGLPVTQPNNVDNIGIATTQSGYNNSTDNFFNGQLALIQKIPFVPGLSARGSIQVSRESIFNKQFFHQYRTYTEDDAGNITNSADVGTFTLYNNQRVSTTAVQQQTINTNFYTLNLSLNYARTFGLHSIKADVIYEQYAAESDNYNVAVWNLPFNSIDQIFSGTDPDARLTGGSRNTDGRLGYIGRVNYDYASKYLVEVSARRDASWRFAPDQRWGTFPAVSAGWVISKEGFMKNSKSIDFLKLRGSWGLLGNDNLGQNGFLWQSVYNLSTNNVYFGGAPAQYLEPGATANHAYTWETSANANIGVDITLWHRLLGISVDVWQKNTRDILYTRLNEYPGLYGAVLPPQNYGKVNVRGYDLQVTHENTIGKVRYGINANFSYNRNKVILIDYNKGTFPWLNPIDKPINYTTGLQALGLFQSDAEAASSATYKGAQAKAGDIKYEDVNKDGIIDDRDTKILSWNNAAGVPSIAYGASFNASYKGFEVNVFFQGVAQRSIFLSEYSRNPLLNGSSYSYFLDYWSSTNTDAKYPRAWEGRNTQSDVNSSFWLKDASFLRLKNVQVAYTIPASITQKWKMSAIRFFISGTNLAVFSKLKNFDPEYPGGSGFYYPQNKSFVFGANISF